MVVSIFKHVYDWGRTCIRLGANLYTIGSELVGNELVMGRNRPLPSTIHDDEAKFTLTVNS